MCDWLRSGLLTLVFDPLFVAVKKRTPGERKTNTPKVKRALAITLAVLDLPGAETAYPLARYSGTASVVPDECCVESQHELVVLLAAYMESAYIDGVLAYAAPVLPSSTRLGFC